MSTTKDRISTYDEVHEISWKNEGGIIPLFGGVQASPGVVHWLCEHAWWLAVDILSYQAEEQPNGVKGVPWQFWNIKRRGNGAVLTCREDDDKRILITQEYDFIDLPYEGDSMDLVVTSWSGLLGLYFLWEH